MIPDLTCLLVTGIVVHFVKDPQVLEIVRTGIVAIERGLKTIYDETKEKGEFNYGKNVL